MDTISCLPGEAAGAGSIAGTLARLGALEALTPAQEEDHWLQQGAESKAPLSSTLIQRDAWATVGSSHGGEALSPFHRPSPLTLPLANWFSVLGQDIPSLAAPGPRSST